MNNAIFSNIMYRKKHKIDRENEKKKGKQIHCIVANISIHTHTRTRTAQRKKMTLTIDKRQSTRKNRKL